MPLSKERNRERMREVRLHVKENTGDKECVQPDLAIVWKEAHPELDIYGRPVQPTMPKPTLVQPSEIVPLYNPSKHRVGDTVKVWSNGRLVTMTIPEVDLDGQPVPSL